MNHELRLPRRCRAASFSVKTRRVCCLASQLRERQPTSDDLSSRRTEPLEVRHAAIIESIRLFVQIPEQVERLDAHVGTLDAALQQRPIILQAVRVDRAIDVVFGVVIT